MLDHVFDTSMVSGLRAKLWTTSVGLLATAKCECISTRFGCFDFGDTGSTMALISLFQIYPWTKIQEAHREMEANKNRFAIPLLLRAVLTSRIQWKDRRRGHLKREKRALNKRFDRNMLYHTDCIMMCMPPWTTPVSASCCEDPLLPNIHSNMLSR